MAKINLLPWREERRKQLTQEFARQAVLVAILAALAGGYAWYHVQGLIEEQKSRNQLLQDEIATLEEDIKEIREIEEKKQRLIKRMNIIQELQQRRPQIVHLFDEIAGTAPDGLYLETLEQSGDDLTLKGFAESNARVSNYMENLNESSWLKSPTLKVIESKRTDAATEIKRFTLSLAQTAPDGDDSGGNNGDAAGGS